MKIIYIDGKAHNIVRTDPERHDGFIAVYVGNDAHPYTACARHWVPSVCYHSGGKVRTGGHTYSMRADR